MTAPVVAFFNNKGGVGKTSLVYHLSWMFADRGCRVLAADLDPQANLTSAFLEEAELEQLWSDSAGSDSARSDSAGPVRTVWDCLRPLQRGVGDIDAAPVRTLDPLPGLFGEPMLVPGDLGLSSFEDDLSAEWPGCLDGKERSFRVISAFARLLRGAADDQHADLVLVDVGPNLGAINRAALVASDNVVVPLAADLFGLQGLRNLGPTLRKWRREWARRLDEVPAADLDLPAGGMRPIGYVLSGHGVRLDRPVKAYQRWMAQIPAVYRSSVLGEAVAPAPPVAADPHCIAQLKHYHSLIPLGMEARKPVFALKAADGAFGGHAAAVQNAYTDFTDLAARLASRLGVQFRR
jgi:chromosome partitioning protein